VKQVLQTLLVVLASIAAVFGASWAKRKLEEIGATKQRDRQQALADVIEKNLAVKDAAIDREATERLEEIRKQRERALADTKEELAREPTPEEVRRLIEESKE